MNKLVLFLCVGLLFTSCDKVKKTQKTITGLWTIHQYKHALPTGLTYYYETIGTMGFGSCNGEVCVYHLKADYVNQGVSYAKYEGGTIETIDDKSFILYRDNPDGSVSTLDYANFLLLTKDQIKLEFADENGLHEFILLK